MSTSFYRWPSGVFQSLGRPWLVLLYRPMPSTPAGDLVAEFATMAEADAAADALCRMGLTLADAQIWAQVNGGTVPGAERLLPVRLPVGIHWSTSRYSGTVNQQGRVITVVLHCQETGLERSFTIVGKSSVRRMVDHLRSLTQLQCVDFFRPAYKRAGVLVSMERQAMQVDALPVPPAMVQAVA